MNARIKQTAFGKSDLENVFRRTGEALERGVSVFLIGGGAMAFRNQKTATKDLDLVFRSARDCAAFRTAIESVGFREKNRLEKAYSEMRAGGGIWENEDGLRLDLFVKSVCGALRLTKEMRARSELLGVFGKLRVFLASNEDVVLFKSVTERPDDVNDMAAIVRSSKIDWDAVLGECEAQSKRRAWFASLLNAFAELKEKRGIDAPITLRVKKLYEARVLEDYAELKRRGGASRKRVLAELRKRGFSKAELEALEKKRKQKH